MGCRLASIFPSVVGRTEEGMWVGWGDSCPSFSFPLGPATRNRESGPHSISCYRPRGLFLEGFCLCLCFGNCPCVSIFQSLVSLHLFFLIYVSLHLSVSLSLYLSSCLCASTSLRLSPFPSVCLPISFSL